MYIDYFSIALLVIALALSIVNIYSMFMVQKHLKSEMIYVNETITNKSFELLEKELFTLGQQQILHQTQIQLNLTKLQTLEQILSHIISSNGGFGGGDGMIH